MASGVLAVVGGRRAGERQAGAARGALAHGRRRWLLRLALAGVLGGALRVLAGAVQAGAALAGRSRSTDADAGLRTRAELGAALLVVGEWLPLAQLAALVHAGSLRRRPRAAIARRARRRRLLTADRVLSGAVLVLVALGAVAGAHAACTLAAAPIGPALAAARAGATPLYFLLPFTYVPVLYGFVAVLEARLPTYFFPRRDGETITLHKFLAYVALVLVALHIAGHIGTVTLFFCLLCLFVCL